MIKITLRDFVGEREVVSGLLGRSIYPQLIASIEKQSEPSQIFIDFAGLMVTGSFISQAILPLRRFARRMDGYLVLCNLNQESLEELQWLLDISPDAVFVCELNESGSISNVRWIGNLEDKQLFTLEAVQREQVVDASKLSELYKGEGIQLTGWNNRLSSLSEKGLLMEIRKGRSKSYRPVLSVDTSEVRSTAYGK